MKKRIDPHVTLHRKLTEAFEAGLVCGLPLFEVANIAGHALSHFIENEKQQQKENQS